MNIIIQNESYHTIVRALQHNPELRNEFGKIDDIECNPNEMLVAHIIKIWSDKCTLIGLATFQVSEETLQKVHDVVRSKYPQYRTIVKFKLVDERVAWTVQNVCERTTKRKLAEVCKDYSNSTKLLIPKQLRIELI